MPQPHNPRLAHLYSTLTAELDHAGRLTLPEALAVCEIQTFDALLAFNKVLRQMSKAGYRQGNYLVNPPAAQNG